MSWLFGIKQDPPSSPPQFPLPHPPPPPGGGDKDGDGKGASKMDAYRFDSAALERAAKAAKDLESSSTTTVALNVITNVRRAIASLFNL